MTALGARRPYVVAVTGGVASGKSAVCDRLAWHGVPVFDADHAARAVVEPGQPALDEIVAAFGVEVLDASGALDRARVRRIVFADADRRRRLEAIVHPRVRAWLAERVVACTTDYCVLAIPLLAEGGRYEFIDRVLVVDVPEALQVERLVRRDGIDAGLAHRMLAAQASRESRLAIADEVIDNDGTLEQLHAAVDALHTRLIRAARAASASDDR